MPVKTWQGWTSVQARLTLVIAAIVGAIAFALLLSEVSDRRRIDTYLTAAAKEHGEFLDRALDLKGNQLAAFASDYSLWGEMVQFVKTADPTWASVNIDVGMGTFGANAAWVFDTAGAQVYAVRDSLLESGPEPLPNGLAVRDMFGHTRLSHYFIPGLDGPIEVRGATIQPSDDGLRKTPARGYFLTARAWNRQYVAELAQLTQKDIRIGPARAGAETSAEIIRQSGEVRFNRPLPGPLGKSELTLTASFRPSWIAIVRNSSRGMLVQLGTLALIGVLGLTLALQFLVTRPLGWIRRSLESGSTEALKPLERNRTEFGQLAQLVGQFFGQNAALVREVTERKRAEAELTEQAERSRVLFEHAPDAVYLSDLHGTFLDGNRAAEELLGYRREELVGKSFLKLNLLPASELPKVVGLLARNALGQATGPDELVLRRKDGTLVTVEICTHVVSIHGRKVVLGSARDITERRHAEEALRESEERFRVLYSGITDAVLVLRVARNGRLGRIVEANDAASRLLGYSHAELLTKSITDVSISIPGPDPQDSATLLGSGRDALFELVFAAKDGRHLFTEVHAGSLKHGEEDAIVYIVRDVTERNRIEAALRQSEERYRRVNESIQDFIYAVDDRMRMTFASGNCEGLLGVPADRLIGQRLDALADLLRVDGPGARAILQRYAQVIAERGETIEGEVELPPSPAGRRWAEVRARIQYNGSGRLIGSTGVVRDVTRRKQAEEALLAKERELSRSNAELEQFAYVASHDLQEPLRMVGSYTQLLARRYEGKLDKDADEFIRFAVDGVARMQLLINDLLTYSRVGRRGKEPQPTDSGVALERALQNLKLAMEDSRGSVTYDPLPVVMADDHQLEQLFQNLIGNAIKYHGDEPPHVHVSAERSNGWWTFAIKDNGIGIEPQHFERIFQVFQRLHTRKEYSGTGIGLAMCTRIVERHGGRIWVESEPSKGSTFRFTLPAKGA